MEKKQVFSPRHPATVKKKIVTDDLCPLLLFSTIQRHLVSVKFPLVDKVMMVVVVGVIFLLGDRDSNPELS